MVDKCSDSAKLGVYVQEFHWQFKYYILYAAGSYFSCGLVFNMQKVSIMLILDNSVSRSPLEVPFARLFVLEIYPISYFKRGWYPIQSLLCSFEAVLIQHFLVIANMSLCASRFSIPESGSTKNHCIGSSS